MGSLGPDILQAGWARARHLWLMSGLGQIWACFSKLRLGLICLSQLEPAHEDLCWIHVEGDSCTTSLVCTLIASFVRTRERRVSKETFEKTTPVDQIRLLWCSMIMVPSLALGSWEWFIGDWISCNDPTFLRFFNRSMIGPYIVVEIEKSVGSHIY